METHRDCLLEGCRQAPFKRCRMGAGAIGIQGSPHPARNCRSSERSTAGPQAIRRSCLRCPRKRPGGNNSCLGHGWIDRRRSWRSACGGLAAHSQAASRASGCELQDRNGRRCTSLHTRTSAIDRGKPVAQATLGHEPDSQGSQRRVLICFGLKNCPTTDARKNIGVTHRSRCSHE